MPVEIAWACDGCGREAGLEDLEAAATLPCSCGRSVPRFPGSVEGGRVVRCALCGDPRLFLQKDFSRRVGIGALVAGFAIAIALGVFVGPWGFFLTLAASLVLDTLFWMVAGNVVICHWCEAHYRGGAEEAPPFDLALHDLVRYQKEVAAAGQRVPEHEGEAAGPGSPEAHPTEYDGRTRPGV